MSTPSDVAGPSLAAADGSAASLNQSLEGPLRPAASDDLQAFNVSSIAGSATLRSACCLWTGCRLAEFETGIRP